MNTVEFFVPGDPAAQGSKRHVGNGRMIEQSRKVGPWRERVALAAHEAMNGRAHIPGGITLALTFVMPRPKSAPKRSTPAATKRPDIDKLERAVLDALTNVVFADDSQVTNLHALKRLAEIGETPGVHIRAEPGDLCAKAARSATPKLCSPLRPLRKVETVSVYVDIRVNQKLIGSLTITRKDGNDSVGIYRWDYVRDGRPMLSGESVHLISDGAEVLAHRVLAQIETLERMGVAAK